LKKIVVMGRGGTGKTSFVALSTKYFIKKGYEPILLIDADPDQNLAEMVGIDLEKEGLKTISELIVEMLEEHGTLYGVPPSDRLEGKIWKEGLYEGEYFDLLAIGTKWVEGCYCLPNDALKAVLRRLIKNYELILIDSPAGVEHLNRRITSEVDDIFDIIDPSKKSLSHVLRAYKIIKEINILFKNFFIVGGFRVTERFNPSFEDMMELEYLGKIADDKTIEEYNLEGKSLLEVPEDSAAYSSVEEILKKAGY